MVAALNAAFSITQYPLKNSVILDSGSTIHIFNNNNRFTRFQQAEEGDYVFAGERRVPIRGYGIVDIQTRGPKGPKVIRLCDVALCENFPCNLVSLRQLHKRGYWWDNRPGQNCLRDWNHAIVSTLAVRHDQFVIEDIPVGCPDSAFVTRRHRAHSWSERTSKADGRKWHLRLGHPGPRALEHLVNASRGARVKGTTTVECDGCALSKMTRQVSRRPRKLGHAPGDRLAIDFHDVTRDQEGQRSVMLVTDRWSGMIWDYYLTDRRTEVLTAAIKDLLGVLKRQYGLAPKVIECDNEIMKHSLTTIAFLRTLHIKVEPSAPYTPAQNGSAEVSGSIIKTKARAMRVGARLPEHLWVEIYRAAVYLHNRTPKYIYSWRTPYDKFHTFLAHRDGVVVENRKPYQAHLRVYGCKAYAMTREAQLGTQKKQRLNPKAWIGFLVGYQSTNIYRIWNPHTGRTISTRDVIFNEDKLFNGDLKQLKDDLLHISRQDLIHLLDRVDQPEPDRATEAVESPDGAFLPQRTWEGLPGEDEDVEPQENWEDFAVQEAEGDTEAEPSEAASDQPARTGERFGSTGDAEIALGLPEGGTDSQVTAGTDDQAKNSDARAREYATPVSLPPAALLSLVMRNGSDDLPEERLTIYRNAGPIEVWKAAFAAGRLANPLGAIDGEQIDKAKWLRLLRNPRTLHRRQMPPLPKHHGDLATHPMKTMFEEAEAAHLRSHEEMNSWAEISKHDLRVRGYQILDCMWVYVYKFDKHGQFQKCKARLVVRGDQQRKSTHEETYAATLAGRSFRTLMAVAARFDLELIQYDAVNAFVNAELDKNVFMRMPPGHRKPGMILMLRKALYGLRESPLLWQRELTATLTELGFKPVPHETCCMTKGGVIIFFYVDDIVLAYRKQREDEVERITRALQAKYKLTGGTPLQWFLGVEIIRDRENKLLWLSQSDYLDKIANLIDRTDLRHDVPMKQEELLPHDELASRGSIRSYQRKIGSILYAAVITRPDVAFAASRLARHNSNPGPEHHTAADQVLLYLRKTKTMALQFGGDDVFTMASDASFADNTLDRKSSQAYAMTLFGGTIGWRANKQSTVTTSTTEAELLALSQAAKEAMFVSRLIKELGVTLDDERIRIRCDNQQTIKLVNKDIATLQTKLRHVDIHNHWLRQEAQRNRILVEYIPTANMIADGLTKPLNHQRLQIFMAQIGLIDISDRLEGRLLRPIEKQELWERMAELEIGD